MQTKKSVLIVVAVSAFVMLSGFGPFDTKDILSKGAIDCAGKDKADRKKCAEGVAVTVAVSALANMVIEQFSVKVKSGDEVLKEYIATGNPQPKKPLLKSYVITAKPGDVTKTEETVLFESAIDVVPGSKEANLKIQEELVIYDPQDPTKEINRSKKKDVNQDKTSGAYVNSFKFAMPKGTAQGKYPIQNHLYFDGKEVKAENKTLQVVQVNADHSIEVIALEQPR